MVSFSPKFRTLFRSGRKSDSSLRAQQKAGKGGENYSSYTNITYNAANERTWADTWANIGLIAVAGTLAGVAISLSAANYELAATLGAVAVGAGGKVVAEAVGDTVGEKVAVGVDDKEE